MESTNDVIRRSGRTPCSPSALDSRTLFCDWCQDKALDIEDVADVATRERVRPLCEIVRAKRRKLWEWRHRNVMIPVYEPTDSDEGGDYSGTSCQRAIATSNGRRASLYYLMRDE